MARSGGCGTPTRCSASKSVGRSSWPSPSITTIISRWTGTIWNSAATVGGPCAWPGTGFHFLYDRSYVGFDSFEGLPPMGPDDQMPIWKAGGLATTEQEFRRGGCWATGSHLTGSGRSKGGLRRASRPSWPASFCPPGRRCSTSTATFMPPPCRSCVSPGRSSRRGTVLVFDDWFCFHGDPDRGQRRAFREFRLRHPEIRFEEFLQTSEVKAFVVIDPGVEAAVVERAQPVRPRQPGQEVSGPSPPHASDVCLYGCGASDRPIEKRRKTMSVTGPLPPLSEELLRSMVPPLELNPVKGGDFREIGETYAGYCRTLCGLAPDHRILDLGCGAGSLAVALLGYLSPSGAYEGLDILPGVIAWCREKVTSRFPNFCFQVADVSNRNFNPTGCLRPTEYRLPYPDASFDVVHLRSVFTHMGPREVEHYLGEIARGSPPEGVAWPPTSCSIGSRWP